MKIPMIRLLACVALGLALGFAAAARDFPPASKAEPVAAQPVEASCPGDEPSSCCYPGMNKENLMTEAQAEAPAAPTQGH